MKTDADRIAELEEALARFQRLDAEAATHVETLIIQRCQNFTGEPPYVGWKGLGLALEQRLDQLEGLCLARSWQPMSTAPKDRPILGWCRHVGEPTPRPDSVVSPYHEHLLDLWRVADGPHVLKWGGEYDLGDGCIPSWWFLSASDFETVANPIAWLDIPGAPEDGE